MAKKSKSKSKPSMGEMPYVPADRPMEQSVKQISNGFIVRSTGVKGGKYIDRETFHPTNPLAGVVTPSGAPAKKERKKS